MVRLRVKHSTLFRAPSPLFQFQYGAIKSSFAGGGMASNNLFQFQYGAIKRVSLLQWLMHQYRISIPVWCD